MFYYDIILVAPEDQINAILDKFNNYHNRIKFTIDYEVKISIFLMLNC